MGAGVGRRGETKDGPNRRRGAGARGSPTSRAAVSVSAAGPIFSDSTSCRPNAASDGVPAQNTQRVDFDTPADLVGITCNTPNAAHVYRMADAFRGRQVRISQTEIEDVLRSVFPF